MTQDTNQPAQMRGLNGYTVDPVFTIGESINGYTPIGILDGLGALSLNNDTVRVFVNHEVQPNQGYAYTLANGTQLTGARVSYFDIDKKTLQVLDGGLAYDTIYNRAGEVVDQATDLEFQGLNRFCSAQYIPSHQFGAGIGLEDGLFFTGEETDGGTEFVLDPVTNTLYAVPWMGRAAWESVTELNTGTTDKVALLVGDDREAAPLLLYVGEKDTSEGADLLARNGLSNGKLYAWVPNGQVGDTPSTLPGEDGIEGTQDDIITGDDDNAPDPFGFNGTGNSLSGTWVELDYYKPELAGQEGYDDLGFATQETQDQLFINAGGFQFSRPEDVATSPFDGTIAVLASTGREDRFETDKWGTLYTIDTDFDAQGNPVTAHINILYDGDDAGAGQFANSDQGLRSPDNLEWADNGLIYVQEDRSTGLFGQESAQEASIWKIEPETGDLTRVAQMNRADLPSGQTDPIPNDIGNWESSGIIDVSMLFDRTPGSLFLFDVQAHSLRDGIIADENLVQGGQLAFLEAPQTLDYQPVFGGLTQDAIEVKGKGQLILAGAGNDLIDASISSQGDNRLYGGQGHDTFILGAGDRLSGAEGDDKFYGQSGGDNLITGGEGADQFWVANGQYPNQFNTITDFTQGEDAIGIAGLSLGFADLNFDQNDGNTLISAGDRQLALLLDFTNILTAADFAFA